MPSYLAPGVYVEEKSSGTKPIAGVSTSVAAFVGIAEKGPVNVATMVSNFAEFIKRFGGPIRIVPNVTEHYLYYSVRHFFAQGGTRCYIVRVADETTALASTAVAANLTVNAINAGEWGDQLSIEVTPTSQYVVSVLQDVAAAVAPVTLAQSDDVRVGSLLWLVDEAWGEISSITLTTITVTGALSGTSDAFAIPNGARVYTPDLALDVTTTGLMNVVAGAGDIPLSSITKSDGVTELQVGDVVNFALVEAARVVRKISDVADAGTPPEPAMLIDFEGAVALPALPAASSRAYQRGFALAVTHGSGSSAEVVEVHENLSLADSDPVNHVSVRLPQDEQKSASEGRSFWISASDTGTDPTLVGHMTGSLGSGNNGIPAIAAFEALFAGSAADKTGLYALDAVKDASILVVTHPGAGLTNLASGYLDSRKDMILIADTPRATADAAGAVTHAGSLNGSSYAALYYPWIKIDDPVVIGRKVLVPPSGAIAGIYARTDGKRGVHKAPAGLDTGSVDVAAGIALELTKAHNDSLHAAKVNSIRKMPEGIIAWGTRTLSADAEWNYIPVRRLFIFLEQSIENGTQWVPFEPNDESLWGKLRRNISAFLRVQWLDGKLYGSTEDEAFFVKCDAETNPQEVVDAGQVITEIGVAPLKPAEFVVFRLTQKAPGEGN